MLKLLYKAIGVKILSTKDKYSGRIIGEETEDVGNWDASELENVLALDNIKLIKNDTESANREDVAHKNTIPRFIAFVVLFAVVLLLAAMAYMKSVGIELSEVTFSEAIGMIFAKSQVNLGKRIASFDYDIKKEILLCSSRDTLLKFAADEIRGIDSTGKVKWKVPFACIEPIGVAEGTYAAVADLSGRSFCVIEGDNPIYEQKVSGNIINISINANGYTAVLYKAEGGKGAMTVFDPQGKEIFTRTLASRYILNAQISPDNREILVGIVDISGVNAYSTFEISDIFGTIKSGIVPKKQDIFPYSWFIGEDAVAIAGDKEIALFSRNGTEIWSSSYRKVFSAEVFQGKYLAVAVSRSNGSESYIEVWDRNERRFASEIIGSEIVNIRSFDDIIAVNTGREVIFLNSRCEVFDRYSPTADILDMQMMNRREIAVITRNNINIFKLGVVN
jgi:hypothetical protein